MTVAALSNKELARRLRIIAGKAQDERVKKTLTLSADRLEKQGHMQAKGRSIVLYTVYDNRHGDLCIAFERPGKECAELMGITYNSFMCVIHRGSKKWTILKRFADEMPLQE